MVDALTKNARVEYKDCQCLYLCVRLNERQARMVSRVFAEGRKGFEGGITTRKYEAITKCPNRTASRDLSDLVAKGIIIPLPGGGRTTRYELTIVEPAQPGSTKK